MPKFTVVYAPNADQTWLKACNTDEACSVRDALALSGVLLMFPEIDLSGTHRVGIFGKQVPLLHLLEEDDRLEIYRPLKQDPKALRRERAQQSAPKPKLSRRTRRRHKIYPPSDLS